MRQRGESMVTFANCGILLIGKVEVPQEQDALSPPQVSTNFELFV